MKLHPSFLILLDSWKEYKRQALQKPLHWHVSVSRLIFSKSADSMQLSSTRCPATVALFWRDWFFFFCPLCYVRSQVLQKKSKLSQPTLISSKLLTTRLLCHHLGPPKVSFFHSRVVKGWHIFVGQGITLVPSTKPQKDFSVAFRWLQKFLHILFIVIIFTN